MKLLHAKNGILYLVDYDTKERQPLSYSQYKTIVDEKNYLGRKVTKISYEVDKDVAEKYELIRSFTDETIISGGLETEKLVQELQVSYEIEKIMEYKKDIIDVDDDGVYHGDTPHRYHNLRVHKFDYGEDNNSSNQKLGEYIDDKINNDESLDFLVLTYDELQATLVQWFKKKGVPIYDEEIVQIAKRLPTITIGEGFAYTNKYYIIRKEK